MTPDLLGPLLRHVNIDIIMMQGGQCTLEDVVIANPLQQDLVATTAIEAGIAALRATKTKGDHYAGHSPLENFIPLAICTITLMDFLNRRLEQSNFVTILQVCQY